MSSKFHFELASTMIFAELIFTRAFYRTSIKPLSNQFKNMTKSAVPISNHIDPYTGQEIYGNNCKKQSRIFWIEGVIEPKILSQKGSRYEKVEEFADSLLIKAQFHM